MSQNDEMAASAGSDAIAEMAALGSSGIWYDMYDTAAKLAALKVGQDDEAISHYWYEWLGVCWPG